MVGCPALALLPVTTGTLTMLIFPPASKHPPGTHLMWVIFPARDRRPQPRLLQGRGESEDVQRLAPKAPTPGLGPPPGLLGSQRAAHTPAGCFGSTAALPSLPGVRRSVCVLSHFSRVQPFVTPWTVARQAPLSVGFSRQEYWSGLPCPPPPDLPNPGIGPASLVSPALAGGFFTIGATWKALSLYTSGLLFRTPSLDTQ